MLTATLWVSWYRETQKVPVLLEHEAARRKIFQQALRGVPIDRWVPLA
jgi:hypothetical protein